MNTKEIYNERIKKRSIFIDGKIDIKMAKKTCQSLLSLEIEDPGVPIVMYIISNGGFLNSGRAIYDFMQSISSPVYTISVGTTKSSAVTILSGGEPGFRFSFPNSSIMIHQPSLKLTTKNTITDLKIRIKDAERKKKQSIKLLSQNSNKSISQVAKAIERDNYLTPREALRFGLIDHIIKDITEIYSKISRKYPIIPAHNECSN